MPHPDDASEPEAKKEWPCFNCQTRGCFRCQWTGFRALTKAEEDQERAEMRRPERA